MCTTSILHANCVSLKVVALEDARFFGFLLALALLLLFFVPPTFALAHASAVDLCRILGALFLLLLFVQIGARGMRRCCSGGWRFIVAVNGCRCVGVSLRSGRGGLFGGRYMLAFASALAPPVAANRKGQAVRITHSTLTKLAKIKLASSMWEVARIQMTG